MVNASYGPAPIFTRPPTPPKENVEDSAKLPIGKAQGTLGQQILLDTPEESPASSSDCFNGSAGRLPKRVVFSPWTSDHKPLHANDKTVRVEGKLRPLPPSKECIASKKSILKVSTNTSSPLFDVSQQLVLEPNETVAAMLRSVNQHLSSASRDSRLDSYKTLLGCLGAYEEVPDTPSLIENLTGFLEYIRRDMSAKQPGSGKTDVELASHALKVLSAILYTPGLTNAVPHEFGNFIAEQAILSVEGQATPKVMLDHHMQLLARQKLSSKILNPEKANRILNALSGLETRVKGNRVVGLKLMIYQRLLVQAKNQMVPRVESWLEFLISSMSSSIKDIRSRAIAFGTDAALALGTTTAVSQSCLDILDRDTPSGPKVVDCLGARMLELLNVPNEGFHVPQIWSVIVLFLRSRRRQLERWGDFQGWLGIMQRAFNSSDVKVKLQANIAWNRLVSVINFDLSTNASFIRMLRQPVASQLERKNSENQRRQVKQLARSTYCNLLYYSFRPGVKHEELDLYWDAFVAPVLSIRPSMTKSDVDFSCEVLDALFSSQQPKLWDQNRAHQLSPMMPGELPCLDPRWIRFRAPRIVILLEGFLFHASLTHSEDVQGTTFFRSWQSFVKAIGDAASKEVKVSMDTMTALAYIVTLLCRYWNQAYNIPKVISCRLDCFVSLVNVTVDKIGFRPFAEKKLLRSSEKSFEATETPSNHTNRARRSLYSPITCLLDMIVNTSHSTLPLGAYTEAIQRLCAIALGASTGRRAQVTLLRQLAVDIAAGRSENVTCKLILWECLAKETAKAISLPQADLKIDRSPYYRSNDYREAVRLLEMTVRDFPSDTYSGWKTLIDAVMDKVQDEVCQEGIPLVCIEPLSKTIHEQGSQELSDNSLRCSTYLLSHASWPDSRQALERARKLLWGPEPVPRGLIPLDPFDYLYTMVESLLKTTYSSLSSFSFDVVAEFLSATQSFLLSCPLSLRAVCLRRLQRGLASWLEDSDAVLSNAEINQGPGILVTKTQGLWKVVVDAIGSVIRPDSSFLADVEDLLVAGFRSRHRAIVNAFIRMWNQTFAKAELLQYPARLRGVFARLRSAVDIGLPGFIEDEETEIMSSPFNFVESQDGELEQGPKIVPHRIACSSDQGTGGSYSNHAPERLLVDKTHSPCASLPPRGSDFTPKGRLRHDDSQILFAAIDYSSPIAAVLESQHLTERQKEVKERQERDAAVMFPDIRSSPRRSRSAERPPELVLHKKQAFGQALDADADPSPTFPPGDATMNDFLGSSPTPHSSCKSTTGHDVNQDSSSLPHGFSLPTIVQRSLGEITATALNRDPRESIELLNHSITDPVPTRDPSKDVNPVPNCQVDHEAPLDNIGVFLKQVGKAHHHMSDPENLDGAPAHPFSDEGCAVMVHDHLTRSTVISTGAPAPTVESPITPCSTGNRRSNGVLDRPQVGDDIAAVRDRVVTQAPFTPTEDELVQEQILRDLEEASSQGNSQVSKRRPSLSSPSEARKTRSKHLIRTAKPHKTVKAPASFLNCEVVVERRNPQQGDGDCIIIDDRPAAGQRRSTPPKTKRERSPSPARYPQPFFPIIPASRKHFARRRTRSMTSAGYQQSPVADSRAAFSSSVDCIEMHVDGRQLDLKEHRPKKRRRLEHEEEADHMSEDHHLNSESSKQSMVKDDQTNRANHTDDQTAPASAEDDMTSSQIELIQELLLGTGNAALEKAGGNGDCPPSSSSDGDTVPNTPEDELNTTHNTGITQEIARSPGQRMLDRFKHLIDDVKRVVFWPEEGKEMVELAFEIVRSVHEAERKNGRQAQ
ncbi:MAG: hypothetical protein Q9170_000037 [Blastenia crenularia]